MKINFKKIASIIATTAMLGSTIAFASAALSLPASDNVVVYGNALDSAAAVDMASVLTGAAGVTTVSGNSKELTKDNVKINLGDAMNSVYSTLDSDELPTILADGIYEDKDGTEYDYEQTISLGTTTLTHFASDDVDADEKPVVGFDIASSADVLNYTLDMTDQPLNSSANMEDTFLEMMGVKYYISTVTSSTSGLELDLLDSANTAVVDSSGPKTMTVGDKSYEVEIVSVSESSTASSSKATLKINGERIDSTNQGNSRKIAPNTYLSIIDVNEASRESDLHYVEFSIGSGKLVLKNGSNVELNDETVDNVATTITTTSGKLDTIKLVWTTDEESYLVPGMDLTLPGFESIKLAMTEFVSPTSEDLTIANSGDDYMQLKDVKVKDGTITNLPILYSDASLNFSGLGKDATHKLVTNATVSSSLNLNEDTDQYFVASRATTDDWESYVFELVSVNEVDSGAHNETKIKNLATGKEITITDSDDVDFGDITLTTSRANGDAGSVTVALSGTNVYADRIYTAAGMGIRLPTIGTGLNQINTTTTGSASWIMNITEGDKDNNVDSTSTNVTLGNTASKGPEVSDIGPAEIAVESGSDNYEGYVISPRATKMLFKTGGDQDTVDIMYPTGESYAKIYVSEASSVTTSTSTVGVVMASALTAADKAKNLIVVGGSCVNTVAAKLLTQLETPVCGAAFSAKTNVGAGQYMIKGFTSPYAENKIAVLVAGYEQAQTLDAVKAAKALTGLTKTTNVVGPTLAN